MIVKNEQAIIERCLESALPYVDTWSITDTGSTDGTAEKIEKFFADRGVPGKISREPFRDFAQARNAAIARAKEVPDWDYALLIDADMVLRGSLDRAALTASAYQIEQVEGSLAYWNTRLVRRDVPAKYVGVTHEYLSVEGIERLASLSVLDVADGGSKGDKGERDVRLLNEGLAREPDNVRYMFYLAQTYRGMGRHHEAVQWYRRRIAAGGWDEEVWHSHYSIAHSYRALGDEPAFIQACVDAYEARPSRGEPLKLLARHLRERGKNHAALLAAGELAAITEPGDLLFVERDVYAWGADQEIAIAGYYVPRWRERGYAACARLTTCPDGGVRDEALKNFTHYARSATDLLGAEVRPIAWDPGDGYAPMNPSVCVGAGGERLVLVRTVNYVVADGQYPTLDGSGVIRTRNHVVHLDERWRVVRTDPVEDISGRLRNNYPVEGLEDCRLWRDGDQFFVSATVRDAGDNPSGQCEVAIGRLDERWRVVDLRPVRDYQHDRTQKNWMPVVGRPGQFLYLCDPTILVDASSDPTAEVARSAPPACLVGLRGGSQLISYDDGYLCITHEVAWRPERVYLHRFVRFDAAFRVTAVSDPFYFVRVGIEFCAGLASDGGNLVASFGVDDASAHLAFFDPDRVRRALR